MSILSSLPGFLAATVLYIASPAAAATFDLLSISGSWVGATQQDASDPLSGLASNELLWGNRMGAHQSGYRFDAAAISNPYQPGTAFDLGTFTHNNYVIEIGSSITRAQLQVTVDVLVGGQTRSITSQFEFLHDETVNAASPCANGANGVGVNRNGCADRVTALTNAARTEVFAVDGVEYTLEITGLLRGGVAFSDFWTVEGEANSAILQASFVARPQDDDDDDDGPSPVPLPAGGWLLLAAVAGLARATRRRG